MSLISFSCNSFHWDSQLIIDPLKRKLHFQRLKELHICFSFGLRARGHETFTPQDRAQIRAWDKFFSEVPLLENLSLAIEYSLRPSILRPYIFKCLLAQRWPVLRVLALHGCAVSEKEFITFVSRHRKSLRHMHLHKLHLYDYDNAESCPLRTLWGGWSVGVIGVDRDQWLLRNWMDRFEFQKAQRPGTMPDRMYRYLRGLENFPYPSGLHYSLRLHQQFVSTNLFNRKDRSKRTLIRNVLWRDHLLLCRRFATSGTECNHGVPQTRRCRGEDIETLGLSGA